MSSRQTGRRGVQKPRVQVEPRRHYTDGDDAAELASEYGLTPDEWQKNILDAWLGRDAHDKLTATSCGLAVPRQNGKNGIIEMRELYGLTIMGESILHTAHEVKTANKAFKRLRSFFENARDYPELARLVHQIRRTNGQESIELTNGAIIEFSARSRGAARGFTVDVVVFDEAQELTDEQMEAIVSTMAAAPLGNRQLIFTGTPPGPKSPGEVFTRVRKDALAKADKHLAWHEWSVEKIGDVRDRERWYATNPALGIRLDEEFTVTELHRLSEDGFARERLGRWASTCGRALISTRAWAKLATETPPEYGKIAYGIKFSPDGLTMALATCIKPSEGNPHVEIVQHRPMSGGTGWIAEWIISRKNVFSVVVIDGKSHVDPLVASLRDGKVSPKAIVVCGVREVVASSTRMLNAVREEKITHYNSPVLNDSATRCEKRPIGDGGGFGWKAVSDDVDVTPMEAASLAYWGAMTSKRRPGRKARML